MEFSRSYSPVFSLLCPLFPDVTGSPLSQFPTMFTKLFRGCTDESRQFPSSRKLKQALERLEEKEIVLQKKISIEVDRAKEFTKTNNRQAAMQCLKRKKFYEVEMEHLASFQLRIHDQEQKLLHNSSVHCGKELSLTRKTTM